MRTDHSFNNQFLLVLLNVLLRAAQQTSLLVYAF
jgi:hypothetical protein